jgi:thioredoxin-related protein
MRKLALSLFSLLLSISSLSAADAPGVPFFQGRFLDLKVQARQFEKPFFVNFYTSWCSPCQNLDNFTFTSPELTSYVKQHYLAYSVDAEGLQGDGVELAQRFDVIFYPTILVFNSRGEVMEKLTGYQTASQLLQVLKKHEKAASPPVIPLNNQRQQDSGIGTSRTETPVTPLPVGSLGLYSLSVSPQARQGYGLQVGVYGDYANVLQEVAKLEASQDEEVLVSINQLKGKTVFKLILGPFSTRKAALAHMVRVKREGLVVDLGRE